MSHLKILAVYLYVCMLVPSVAVSAEPLNLTLPKTISETELKIFTVDPRSLTPPVALVLAQIEKKIERSAAFISWPRFDSGEKAYGSVQILITIGMDGSVKEVEPVYQGLIDPVQKLLREAAINIVELAAPFAPIPRESFYGFDAIRFYRTFTFNHGESVESN